MLAPELIRGFKQAGIIRRYSADEPIFLANEPSTGMYLILEGEVKVLRRLENGQTIEVATVGQGETMGEISLLLGQPHSATVIAKTKLEVSLLTHNRLDDLRKEDPVLAMRLFEILAYTLSNHVMNMNVQLDAARKTIARLEKRLHEEESTYSYF